MAYLRRTSMTWGRSLSLFVAGSLSRFACSSSAAAPSMASRRRETSSSAKRSRASSSSFLRFFCRELFFGLRMASNCISSRSLLAGKGFTNRTVGWKVDGPFSGGRSARSSSVICFRLRFFWVWPSRSSRRFARRFCFGGRSCSYASLESPDEAETSWSTGGALWRWRCWGTSVGV